MEVRIPGWRKLQTMWKKSRYPKKANGTRQLASRIILTFRHSLAPPRLFKRNDVDRNPAKGVTNPSYDYQPLDLERGGRTLG